MCQVVSIMFKPHTRTSTYEPELSDEDVEAIGDAALGILPGDGAGMTSVDIEETVDVERRRAIRIGASLTARQASSDKRKQIFIRTLATTGIVGRAATAAGWTTSYAHGLKKSDPEFMEMWINAIDFATDALEEAARRRAVDGVVKPVFQQGRLVGHVTEYSDGLLTTLLKAKRPKEFRDNISLDAEVKGGVLVVPGVSSSSAWEQAALTGQANFRTHQGDEVEDAEEAPDPLA
jgi:hypothetical protein